MTIIDFCILFLIVFNCYVAYETRMILNKIEKDITAITGILGILKATEEKRKI